jgi:hypothetical protein
LIATIIIVDLFGFLRVVKLNFKIDMKKPILFPLIFIAFMMLVACSKTERMYEKIFGDYTLVAYTVDGVDSLSSYKDSLGTNHRFYHDERDKSEGWEISGKRNDGKEKILIFVWELNKNNELEIILANEFGSVPGPFGINGTGAWQILNLTKKELQMKIAYSGKDYIIDLIKN